MIYLHHAPLTRILSLVPRRLSLDDKKAIRSYRHELLSQFCKLNDAPVPAYGRDELGKPICINIPNLSFNHSQCPTDYALAYSLDLPNVGVDIEHTSRVLNFESLARRFYHPDEMARWLNSGDITEWFRIWTIKEAVLKACGLGMRMTLSELNAQFINDHQGVVSHERIGAYRFECVQVDGAMITVAYPSEYGTQDWQWS